MSVWNSPPVARARLSVALLLDRRAALFAWVDGFFIFSGLMMAFAGSGHATEFWPALVLMPTLILGVPMLAEVIAVERRSGTLDLALSSPGANWYFERRILAASLLILTQALCVVCFVRLGSEPFPLAPAVIQVFFVIAFVAATVLNWAVRLKTPGAVIFASYATALAFSPWFFSNPIRPPGMYLRPMNAADIAAWARANLVLGGAALVLYLFAVQRLSKPESIIT
jgi:ABC-type Na+ efflux pump permease subunit